MRRHPSQEATRTCETCQHRFQAWRKAHRTRFCSRACYLQRARTLPLRRTREYRVWGEAKGRCYRLAHPERSLYGGRGIAMCDHWRNDFHAFLADMGPCPQGHSLDRIDNDGPYSPENCRWATAVQQNNNRRTNRTVTLGGRTIPLGLYARECGLPLTLLSSRRYNGWPDERLSEPKHSQPSR